MLGTALDGGHEKTGNLIGGIGFAVDDPPFDGFGEAADEVVEQKISGCFIGKINPAAQKEIPHVAAERLHEQFAAFAGQDPSQIAPMLAEMIEDVAEFQLEIFAPEENAAFGFLREFLREDMVEDVGAQRAEKFILGFEMGIEGAASDVGFIDDLLNGDALIALFLQKPAESLGGGWQRRWFW